MVAYVHMPCIIAIIGACAYASSVLQWVKKLPQCLCILGRLVLCEGMAKAKILHKSHNILEHAGYLPNEESCDSN